MTYDATTDTEGERNRAFFSSGVTNTSLLEIAVPENKKSGSPHFVGLLSTKPHPLQPRAASSWKVPS
jgi:hypothetical protein